MKNKMKYLIATGVLVAGCAGLKSVKSEAALRGRILGIFSSCTTCMRGNGKSPIKNLKISSNLKENAKVSAISKPLVGESSSNFDTSK